MILLLGMTTVKMLVLVLAVFFFPFYVQLISWSFYNDFLTGGSKVSFVLVIPNIKKDHWFSHP